LRDAKDNEHSFYVTNDSSYKTLMGELTDLNLRKVEVEKCLNETKAESVATILEEGGNNYSVLYE